MQLSLTREHMLFEFELRQNTAETTKIICCAGDRSAVDHSRDTRLFKKCCSARKNHDNQVRLDKLKTSDYKVVSQVMEANPSGCS